MTDDLTRLRERWPDRRWYVYRAEDDEVLAVAAERDVAERLVESFGGPRVARFAYVPRGEP